MQFGEKFKNRKRKEILSSDSCTFKANSQVSVYEGPVELSDSSVQKRWIRAEATVVMKLLPTPQIEIEASEVTMWGHHNFTTLRLPSGPDIDVYQLKNVNFLPSKPIVLKLNREPITAQATSDYFSSVTFLVLNFPFPLQEFATFQVGAWHYEFTTCRNFKESRDLLTLNGGYAVTHVGLMKRQDGAPFYTQDVENNLKALHNLLSFTRGGRCGIALARGFNIKGETVWQQWGSFATEIWRNLSTWVRVGTGCEQNLAQIFPGFMNALTQREYLPSELIHMALFLYLASNNSNDSFSGIVLSQAALERLTREFLSDTEWGQCKNFSARLERALQKNNICTDVPSNWEAIARIGDGPKVITEIRNNLIHSDASNVLSNQDYSKVEALGQWYASLLLLRKFEYQGRCINRLAQIDNIEPKYIEVPWRV